MKSLTILNWSQEKSTLVYLSCSEHSEKIENLQIFQHYEVYCSSRAIVGKVKKLLLINSSLRIIELMFRSFTLDNFVKGMFHEIFSVVVGIKGPMLYLFSIKYIESMNEDLH
jgi:hypothetical protein